jgi:hypothetical protein
VILDTALYEDGRAELLRPENISTNLRRFPTAFKLYTGASLCHRLPHSNPSTSSSIFALKLFLYSRAAGTCEN